MNGILHAISELIDVVVRQRVNEPRHAPDIENGFLPRNCVAEHPAGGGSLSDLFGDEAHALQTRRDVDTFRHPSDACVDAQLDSSVKGWCNAKKNDGQ